MGTLTLLRHAMYGTMISMIASVGFAASAANSHRTDGGWLRQTLVAREAALSRAYNTCNLHALRASLFAGTAIITPDGQRIDPVIDARDRICARLDRQLIPGSVSVRALGDDSALVTGMQRFCGVKARPCAVQGSKFVHLWTLDHGHWRIGWMRRYVGQN